MYLLAMWIWILPRRMQFFIVLSDGYFMATIQCVPDPNNVNKGTEIFSDAVRNKCLRKF